MSYCNRILSKNRKEYFDNDKLDLKNSFIVEWTSRRS